MNIWFNLSNYEYMGNNAGSLHARAPDALEPEQAEAGEQARPRQVQPRHRLLDAAAVRHYVQAAIVRHIALRMHLACIRERSQSLGYACRMGGNHKRLISHDTVCCMCLGKGQP